MIRASRSSRPLCPRRHRCRSSGRASPVRGECRRPSPAPRRGRPTRRLTPRKLYDSWVLTSSGAGGRLDTLGRERPQLLSDLLHLRLGLPAAHREEARSPGLVLEHPVFGPLAALDIREDRTHPLSCGLVDDLRPRRVVAVLGGVRDRVAHPRKPALVDQVDDELELVYALIIGELGLVARLDERLESGREEGRKPPAQHRLLPKEVSLGLVCERGLDNAGAAAPCGAGVGEDHIPNLPRSVVLDRKERRHHFTLDIKSPEHMSWTLGSDET